MSAGQCAPPVSAGVSTALQSAERSEFAVGALALLTTYDQGNACIVECATRQPASQTQGQQRNAQNQIDIVPGSTMYSNFGPVVVMAMVLECEICLRVVLTSRCTC